MSEKSYYDFLAEFGVPYFHFGGMKATEKISELCHIKKGQEVLMVGCGTGYSSVYIVQKYNCKIIGIDISEVMIEKANERLDKHKMHESITFQVADAQKLPFENNTFDVVLSEFVTIFLEKEKAFKEYVRVLKSGGFLGINELYKDDEIPQDVTKMITKAEKGFRESIKLPFTLFTPTEWKKWFRDFGLLNIQQLKIEKCYGIKNYVKASGGIFKITKMLGKALWHFLFNTDMKDTFMKVGKSKDILLKNKDVKKYTGSLITVGQREVIPTE